MATISEWRRYLTPTQALEAHIAYLESQLRFHDAAEGPQYFAEQAQRDLIQRELDRARAQLRESQP